MFHSNPLISKLIMKWATSTDGNWKDVENDLVELIEAVRQEERDRAEKF